MAKRLLQHAEERLTDGVIVLVAHSVAHVARAKIHQDLGQLRWSLQQLQRLAQKIQQLLGLHLDVLPEERPQCRVEGEQATVKDQGRHHSLLPESLKAGSQGLNFAAAHQRNL